MRMYNPADEVVPVEVSGVSAIREMTMAEAPLAEVRSVDGVYGQKIPAKRIVTLEVE